MQLSKGKIFKAQKILIYGPEGIGKTTFASKFPGAVFIDTEGSTLHYDVTRFPYPVTSWQMLISDVHDVISDPSICKTLIIDTADWAEHLCESSVISEHQITSIEDPGYGKGYTWIREEFGKLLNLLSDVTNAGINVVLTAHAQMRKFEQPDALGAYDRWELKLSKQVAPLVKEWTDIIIFANFKTYTVEVAKGGKANDKKLKATGSRRVMYLTHHQCWDAKNRWGISDDIDNPADFDYKLITEFMEERPAQKANELKTPEPPEPVKQEQSKIEPQVPASPKEPPKDSSGDKFIPLDESSRKEETEALNIPQALKDLMLKDDIGEWDLRTLIGAKGYYPEDMAITDYPDEFVNGWILKFWPNIIDSVTKMRKNQEIPFD